MIDTFPPRLIVGDEQIIVILDTAPVRILGEHEDCPPWVETFVMMAGDGYCFSLADGTFVELLNQRSRGSLTAIEFHRMCSRLERFISSELPVTLGRRDLLGMIQQSTAPWSEKKCRRRSLNAWAELKFCANSGHVPESLEQLLEEERQSWRATLANFQEKLDDLKNKVQLKIMVLRALDEAGLIHALSIMSDPLNTLEALHSIHSHPNEEMFNSFNPIPNHLMQKIFDSLAPLSRGDLTGVLHLLHEYLLQKQYVKEAETNDATISWKKFANHQNSWKIIGPKIYKGVSDALRGDGTGVLTMRMRSHLETIYYFTQFSNMQKPQRAYDPNSENSRNDGIDFDLYRFLKLPAFVVTLDKGFLEGLTDVKSYQTAWFFRPQELADSWSVGARPEPRWPAAKDVAKRQPR